MKIDVFFDPICPWCYIGAKRLEQSLALYQKQRADASKTSKKKASEQIDIYWRMFQLNPSMPKTGMLRADYSAGQIRQSGGLSSGLSPHSTDCRKRKYPP